MGDHQHCLDVSSIQRTQERTARQKGEVYLESHVLKLTKFNSTLCKLTYFGKVYSDYLLSTGSCLRTTTAERGLSIITDDSYQCGPVMKESNSILGSIKTDKR